MAALIYNSLIDLWSKGSIDFDTDTFKGLLLTDAYVPDRAVHDYRNDLTNEITGTGYTAGGIAVPVTSVKNTAANTQVITFGLALWTGFVGSTYAIAYYKSRGGAADADELCAYNSFGQTINIDDPGTFVASPTIITLAIR